MSEIVFLLEELSAKAMLEGLLPRLLLSGIGVRYIVFDGKQDLERQLIRRIRGYRTPNARFMVLRDQDFGDCLVIKAALQKKCYEAGHQDVLVRIACRQLESWYIADLAAVETALGLRGLRKMQNRNPYRSPDNIGMPSKILIKLAPSYQKIAGSRLIGPCLDIENKRSVSFFHFITAVRQLADELNIIISGRSQDDENGILRG